MSKPTNRPKLRRFRYRDAIEWIAWNDEPTEMDPANMEIISVSLIADLYGLATAQVANDVVKYRERKREEQRRREAILERKMAAITPDEVRMITDVAEGWWESVAHDACAEGVPAPCDIADLVISSGAIDTARDERISQPGSLRSVAVATALQKFLDLPPGTRGDFLEKHCQFATP